MRILSIDISNYKGIDKLTLELDRDKNVSLIIGNNVGQSRQNEWNRHL